MLKQLLPKSQRTVFTAGDLVDGLGFMEPVYRCAVLFGLETGLSCGQLTDLTFRDLSRIEMTSAISRAVIESRVRHIRLPYVFWTTLDTGIASPLMFIEYQVMGAFGGMSWSDLKNAYSSMVWVDEQVESDHFWMTFNASR